MILFRAVFLIVPFLLNVNEGQDFVSPCPRLFVYEGKGTEPDRWYGIVTLLSESDLSGIWLRLIFDKPSLQLGNWFGQVATTDNKEYLIKRRDYPLKAHVPQTVRFYLKYNPAEPPPKLLSFRLNAKTVCPEGAATESSTVPMELQTSSELETPSHVGGGGGGNIQNNGNNPTRPSSFYPGSSSSGDDEEPFRGDFFNFFNPPQGNNVDSFDLNAVCGTVVTRERTKRQTYQSYPYRYQYQYTNPYNPYPYSNQYPSNHYDLSESQYGLSRVYSYLRNLAQPRPLISYGNTTREGEFPWHVALYHSKGIDLAYICGASLVSKSHVLTVAHCVTRRRSQVPLNTDHLVVYLGKYYLKGFSGPGIQYRQVSMIVPHPQYNAQNYGHDIAVVKLATAADITDYVRPVCLWQESPNLSSVLNKLGSVVGWGFDENGKVTEQLMQAKMPVVSQETCIFSFPDFYSRFTSGSTYCAGFRNGTSVCNGDSGGGMVFPKPGSNRNNPVWQLRGLVSISVALQNQFKCDTSHYVVFTDTAKYLDFIKSAMMR